MSQKAEYCICVLMIDRCCIMALSIALGFMSILLVMKLLGYISI